jgi:hypothetical protein
LLLGGGSLWSQLVHGTVTGHGKDAVITIDAPSDTCWTAYVADASHEGCGPTSIPVHDELGMFSSSVQKSGDGSATVGITITQDGNTLATNSTSAAYGLASVIAS